MKRLLAIAAAIWMLPSLVAAKAIQMDFTSFGAGIDVRSYQQVKELTIKQWKAGHIDFFTEEPWGLEGEITLCVQPAPDTNVNALITRFKALTANPQTHISTVDRCQRSPTQAYACTKDLNEWGHPSRCQCPTASVYNEIIGQCQWVNGDYQASICSKDLNPWGNPSRCRCKEAYSYNPETWMCSFRFKSGVLHMSEDFADQSIFTLVSYDGHTKTEVVFKDKALEQQARVFAERRLPCGLSGHYKVFEQDRQWRVLFVADELNVEE